MTGIGTSAASAPLVIKARSAFSATLTRSSADWADAPVIEFFTTAEDALDNAATPIATWTATIDGAVATFSEDRATAQARTNGESYQIRDTTADEVIVVGKVVAP